MHSNTFLATVQRKVYDMIGLECHRGATGAVRLTNGTDGSDLCDSNYL